MKHIDVRRDGGPIFPGIARRRSGNDVTMAIRDGLSLRDYFAGQAIAGIVCVAFELDRPRKNKRRPPKLREGFDFNVAAATAYGIADSLIGMREMDDEAMD